MHEQDDRQDAEELRAVRASQGSQPRFADVRVGIMRIGVREGRALVQLALRSPRGEDVVVVDEGEAIDLHGAGLLHLDEVHGVEGSTTGEVVLSFHPAGRDVS
ncbi:hypothetical protein [Cellulosimicrobium arenosum]|uniref:Uncharacterized protein n=1 Tax=Cellulosimicrobium arenosum TaxID=2708133 RepID=A0A927G809_9MICO|nr:hypothetical protein [Cellulosimicrobium arenosum]MBD8078599.1 hypothetical protein [Cellulosimicrobium arenosum]